MAWKLPPFETFDPLQRQPRTPRTGSDLQARVAVVRKVMSPTTLSAPPLLITCTILSRAVLASAGHCSRKLAHFLPSMPWLLLRSCHCESWGQTGRSQGNFWAFRWRCHGWWGASQLWHPGTVCSRSAAGFASAVGRSTCRDRWVRWFEGGQMYGKTQTGLAERSVQTWRAQGKCLMVHSEEKCASRSLQNIPSEVGQLSMELGYWTGTTPHHQRVPQPSWAWEGGPTTDVCVVRFWGGFFALELLQPKYAAQWRRGMWLTKDNKHGRWWLFLQQKSSEVKPSGKLQSTGMPIWLWNLK